MKLSEEKLHNLRHSLAHILASAVLEMFPKGQLGVGPVIENCFFYDFLLPRPLAPEDIKKIEKRMRELVKQKLAFQRQDLSIHQAKKYFTDNHQPFKLELIKDIEKHGTTVFDEIEQRLQPITYNLQPKSVSLYQTGKFTDLCRGGHVNNTSEIDPQSFKLDKISGAYWRGDHKKLGPKLGLFMFHHSAPGMPYWLPKGVLIYNELVNFWRSEHTKRNYQEIVSPLLNKKELYQTSGHFEHYWQDMYSIKTKDNEEYALKAMNCPNAMVVFGSQPRSYKDLPLRLSDTDTLHRNEISGALNGLLRVREFRQDDAHCFVTEDQIGSEYEAIFEIVDEFYSLFNLEYSFRLGTRPESFMGEVATWNKAEETLKKILKKNGHEFTIAEKDGAFYGPKVDILMKDALGREWQMGTIQLDFQQPQRFKLEY